MSDTGLIGNFVYLRPVRREDYEDLYSWRIDTEHLHRWSPTRRLVTFDEFIAELNNHISSSLLLTAIEVKTGDAVGFVQVYGASPIDGFAHLLIYVDPDYWNRGYAVEIGLLVTRHLFQNYGMRKIYAEVYEFNEQSRRLVERLGFVLEGTRRKHLWYNDRFWDVYLYALYREEWGIRHSRWDDLMRVREDVAQLIAVHAARKQDQGTLNVPVR